jgi:hypothetical protein
MRPFILLAIIVCLVDGSVGQQRKPDSSATAQDVHSSPAAQQPPVQTTIVQIEREEPAKQTERAETPQCKHCWPETVSALGTLMIALLTGVYVVVTGSMLSQLKKDVRIARDAANAATITARASVNAERAWIRPSIQKGDRKERIDNYRLECSNDGRTPGRVIGYAIGPRFIPANEKGIQALTEEKPTKTNVWVSGGQSETTASFNLLDITWDIPGGDRIGVDTLILHGWVEYVAIVEFDPATAPVTHRTTFYYQWDPNDATLGHKPTYTNYT